MRRASLSVSLVIAGSALLCVSGSVQALGFGRSINASHLGQPLNFAATVRLEGEESLPRECVAAEVLSGDFRVAPAALRISVEPGTNPNERQVRISTTTAIDEPVVTVTLTVGCQARLTRSFVTLVDPPGVNLAGTAAPEVTLPPQRLESDVAPVVAVSQGVAAASAPGGSVAPAPAVERPVRPRAVAAATVPTPRSVSAAAARPRERKRAAPPVATARSGGARLQLEAGSAAVVAAAASAVASTQAAAAQAVAAAASEVVASNMAAASAAASASAAQERIASLEEQLRLLREESKKTQQALATLQSSLNDAQSSRYANPLVYGLAWLSALLALAVAALWWRQSQMRTSSQWWLAPTGGNAGATASVKPVATRSPVTEAAMARQETQPAVMDDRSIARSAADDEPMPTAAPPLDAPVSVLPPVAEPAVPRRELSVEELIDLEQQADFFVVLGQDDAAIDLLMGHVRSSGGASPLPYLKLLEIYRRRGDRDAYERVRERFNRRFSAYAPDWDNDLAQGRTLDDYPQVLRQLQRLWDEPMRVTHMLDAALMRQDADGETFDLPAYRELLFLYSIARDLAEHPTNARAVDLLLPMDGEASEKPIEELTASRLMGFAPTNQLTVQVDLDVTRPMPDPGSSDFMGLVDPKLKRGDGDRY